MTNHKTSLKIPLPVLTATAWTKEHGVPATIAAKRRKREDLAQLHSACTMTFLNKAEMNQEIDRPCSQTVRAYKVYMGQE